MSIPTLHQGLEETIDTDMTLFVRDLRKKRAISVALIGLIVLDLNSELATGDMITAGITNKRAKASVKEALVKQASSRVLSKATLSYRGVHLNFINLLLSKAAFVGHYNP